MSFLPTGPYRGSDASQIPQFGLPRRLPPADSDSGGADRSLLGLPYGSDRRLLAFRGALVCALWGDLF